VMSIDMWRTATVPSMDRLLEDGEPSRELLRGSRTAPRLDITFWCARSPSN
jgi:hypothetical protein